MFGPPSKHTKLNFVPPNSSQSAPKRPRGAFGGPPKWGRKAVLAMRALTELDPRYRGATAFQQDQFSAMDARAEEQRIRAQQDANFSKALDNMGMPGMGGLSPEQLSFLYGAKRDGVSDSRDLRDFNRGVLESDRGHEFRVDRADRSDFESDRTFEAGRDDARHTRMHSDRVFEAGRDDAAHRQTIDYANLALAETAAAQKAQDEESPYSAGEIKALREKGEQLQGFRNSLNSYIKAIEDNGVQAFDVGGRNKRAAQLDAMRQDLMFQGKNLWELGVLSKDDYDNMAKAIPDATGVGTWINGTGVALTKAQPLLSSIEYQLNRIPEDYRSFVPPGGDPDFPNAPAIGTVDNGFRFIGGNPADPNSWEQV